MCETRKWGQVAGMFDMPEWTMNVYKQCWRSGSGLCWGATRRGIAGRKLTVMQPTPANDARRRRLFLAWAVGGHVASQSGNAAPGFAGAQPGLQPLVISRGTHLAPDHL